MSEAGGRRTVRRTFWRWIWPQLALAVMLGAAWWVLAPGGRSDSGGGYLPVSEAPGSQDSWIAVLSAGAGLLVALWWVVRRPASPDRGSVAAVSGALVGAVLAGAAAVGVGLGIDLLAGAATAAGEPVVTRLRPRAPAAALLWPLALLVMVLVDTGREMLGSWLRGRRRRGADVS